MNSKSTIQILGSLEELISQYEEDCKIKSFQIDSTNYGLLLYTADQRSISFFKLRVNELLYERLDGAKTPIHKCEKELYKFTLLNVFCLSFNVIDTVCTEKNVWAVGYKSVVDLKPYIVSVLENFKSMQDDEFMDIDDIEEFNPEMFSININVPKSKENYFNLRDIFVGCNFLDNGFVLCRKNSKLERWQIQFMLLKSGTAPSDWTSNLYLDFPVQFGKSTCSSQEKNEVCYPAVIFIDYNDPERLIFENLFGISCQPSSAVCLVGHPEGKLLWSLYDYAKKFHSSAKLQPLLDTKQPIVYVDFFNHGERSKDSGCMLIVGSLGQVTLVSSKKRSSFSFVSGTHSFWIRTYHLNVSVTSCATMEKCLLHFSRTGKLWITDLSKLIDFNGTPEDFCSASSCSELSYIQQVIPLAKHIGLTLLRTISGNLYLTMCQREISSFSSSSLPLLMNECLVQSTSMQELLEKKTLQSRLFACIATFISLKFSENILEEPVTFSISEINLHPRKYLLVINFQCLEKLHLDPELCYVSASVSTHVKDNNTLITKTVAYDPEEPTLCLELTDTVLQPMFLSIFPLLIEIGLILQLPYKWKTIDCFQTVSTLLPFYFRIQTLMVHELHLLHCNSFGSSQSSKFKKSRTLQKVKELATQRPISNVLKIGPNYEYTFPVRFNLCLTASSVAEMMKNKDSDPCIFIEKLLFGKTQSDTSNKGALQISKGLPHSVTIAKKNDSIVITVLTNSFESLIALRIAVMDILLSYRNQITCLPNSSRYVTIPAIIYRRCEEILKSLMNLYGKDIESGEVTQSLLQLYGELRADVSAKLPIL